MPVVKIIDGVNQMTVPARVGQSLDELLHRYVPTFAMPCAGNHTCGKCLVTVSGEASPVTETEHRFFEKKHSQSNVRLACCCKVEGDLTVTVKSDGNARILSRYQLPAFQTTEKGYGFAVDIGTTTIAMQLIDRSTGQVLAERLSENPQRGFGADVISRIEACKTYGIHVLSDLIVNKLEEMAADCLQDSGVTNVCESVVTGNSTMLHIYEGLDPGSLAVAPFTMQSYFGYTSKRTLAGSPVYLPRCIGAYVGADITCALLATDDASGKNQLLTDIGTNGEIALKKGKQILCCATAAGPAFEGTGLSCGMPASTGAICAIRIEKDNVVYQTIGNAPAAGVCGSGILDALASMLKTEIIDDTGYLDEDWEIGNSGIIVTQRDIRQIQLAKAAICAGILTLLEHNSLGANDIDRFVIAGGFGSSMNHNSAAAIGLFPSELRPKTDFIGNGALGGAVMLLCSKKLREESSRMAEQAVELPLSASPMFMEHYIDCMSFEMF